MPFVVDARDWQQCAMICDKPSRFVKLQRTIVFIIVELLQ